MSNDTRNSTPVPNSADPRLGFPVAAPAAGETPRQTLERDLKIQADGKALAGELARTTMPHAPAPPPPDAIPPGAANDRTVKR